MPEGRRGELSHAIWDALLAAGVANVKGTLPAEAPHAEGWIQLAEIYGAHVYDPPAFATAIAGWQANYPEHPAQTLLLAELLERAEEAAAPPTKIALLLPLQGPLAGIGNAIRDGFIAMRFSGAMNPPPDIGVYDVNAANVVATARAAVAEGANFIVGPLDKGALDTLLAAGEPPVPMLALNTASKPPTANSRLFQFGLRPEDEAIDAAERAWQDGRRRMIAMVPANELGQRLQGAFTERWRALGGTVVEEVSFQNNVGAYAAAVRQTFGLQQSEARAAALRRLLQRALVAEARRRDDVDGIMLSAPPVEARQILPQFRFLRRGKPADLRDLAHLRRQSQSGRRSGLERRDVRRLTLDPGNRRSEPEAGVLEPLARQYRQSAFLRVRYRRLSHHSLPRADALAARHACDGGVRTIAASMPPVSSDAA